LDGQPVMAMFRRSPNSSPPLRRRQEELMRREQELRERVEHLERVIVETSQITGERSRPGRNEKLPNPNPTDRRFRVSVELRDERYAHESGTVQRPRALRKQRREGRMVFLVLMIALAAAVIWLMGHLHF